MGRWKTVARGRAGRTAWWRCRAIVALVAVLGALGLGTASAADVSAGWRSPVKVNAADGYVYDSGVDLRRFAIDDQNAPSAHGMWGARDPSPSLDSTGHFYDPVGSFVAPSGAVDDLARGLCSFSGETEVLMADGTTKPISEVEVGDEVLAVDPETGVRGPRQVTHLWVHQDRIIDLEIDDHPVGTTEDHPFWNHTDREWQRADALDAGDLVLAADGDLLTVNGVHWGSARTTTAYNLTVDDIHTYFVEVGRDEVLVHNTCPWELDALSASGQRVISNDGLTRAAQKLQQHGGQGNLPVISGNVATRNALATDLLDDILTAPGTRAVTNQGGNFAGGRTFIDPLGRGAVYDADGVFQYFGTFR